MSDTSSIDDILSGVVRLLDERPDLRAKVAVVELSRSNGEIAAPPFGPVSLPGMPAPAPGEGIVRPVFNLAGHAVIAYIAEQYLETNDPDTWQALQRVKASDPLGRGDIGSFAIWPDQIKHPPAGREAEFAQQKQRLGGDRRYWHYVNIPYNPKKKTKPDPTTASGDLLKQLPGQLDLLANDDELTAADALCFVLHLVGDLHQPLHCAALADGQYFSTPPEYDQGGNLIRWGKDAPRTQNLHALWDDAIAAKSGDVEARVQQILSDHPRGSFSAAELGLALNAIAVESFDLAKKAYDDFFADVTYQGASQAVNGGQQFSSPSPEYRKNAQNVCRERAALAGYRLAQLLAEHLPSVGAHATKKKKKAKRRRRKKTG